MTASGELRPAVTLVAVWAGCPAVVREASNACRYASHGAPSPASPSSSARDFVAEMTLGRPRRAAPEHRESAVLLDRHLGASGLEELLGLVGLLLLDLLQHRLGRALDEVLGLLEAQTRDRTDFLNHFDLLVA